MTPWPLLGRLVPALAAGADLGVLPSLDATQGHHLMQELIVFLRGAAVDDAIAGAVPAPKPAAALSA